MIHTCRALLKVHEDYDTLGFQKDYPEARLKRIIGTATGIDRVGNWNTVVAHQLDAERLRAERFDVYTAFLSEGRSRRFMLFEPMPQVRIIYKDGSRDAFAVESELSVTALLLRAVHRP